MAIWRFPMSSVFLARIRPEGVVGAFRESFGAQQNDQVWLRGKATGWDLSGPGGNDWVFVPKSQTAVNYEGYLARALEMATDVFRIDAMAIYCTIIQHGGLSLDTDEVQVLRTIARCGGTSTIPLRLRDDLPDVARVIQRLDDAGLIFLWNVDANVALSPAGMVAMTCCM